MERLLAIWCPGILEEQERGREARLFGTVVAALEAFATRVDPVRPGVCAVPTRGPSRYFGGDEALARMAADVVAGPMTGVGVAGPMAGVGVADGLFAAVLAARAALGTGPVIVPAGETPSFLVPWPLSTLDRPELADLLARLGVRTLGAFAALPGAHVLARFGAEAALCQRVARGAEGELPGFRLFFPGASPGPVFPGPSPGPATAVVTRQAGFWGDSSDADARAARAVAGVQGLLGPEAVVRGRLQGGRGPARARPARPLDRARQDRRGRRRPGRESRRAWPGRPGPRRARRGRDTPRGAVAGTGPPTGARRGPQPASARPGRRQCRQGRGRHRGRDRHCRPRPHVGGGRGMGRGHGMGGAVALRRAVVVGPGPAPPGSHAGRHRHHRPPAHAGAGGLVARSHLRLTGGHHHGRPLRGAPLPFQFQLPRRCIAPRGAGRGGGPARPGRPRPHRPRRPLRGGPFRRDGPGARVAVGLRRRAHPGGRRTAGRAHRCSRPARAPTWWSWPATPRGMPA